MITPHAGIVDHNTAIDAVFGVVDLFGGVGIDDLDFIAVGDESLSLFINADCALKNAVHGISTQQTRALEEVVLCLTPTHHDGTQPEAVATVRFGDEYPRHKASDATKPVQHHINRFLDRLLSGINQIIQFLGNVFLNGQPFPRSLVVVGDRKAANIKVAGTEVELAQNVKDRSGLKLRQFVVLHLPHPTMALHDVEY